jgi:Protein of unknown function (DUF1360)
VELVRQLFRLLILWAINHQVTHICVAGSIFEETRKRCGNLNPKLGQLVSCHLCFGTWVGFLQALLFRPRFIEPRQGRLPIQKSTAPRRLAAFFADAFAIALVGRFFTELLAILAGQAAVKKDQEQLLEAELQARGGMTTGEPRPKPA